MVTEQFMKTFQNCVINEKLSSWFENKAKQHNDLIKTNTTNYDLDKILFNK